MTIRAVEFKTNYSADKEKEPVDMVLLAPSGEGHLKTQTWHRVKNLRPPEGLDDRDRNADTHVAMTARWSVIEPAYKAWKAGTEIPENGTPLAAWSGVTADQAGLLRNMAIRTVEDVRDMSESAFTKLPMPNARKLPQLARDWLEGADSATKDAKISDLEERMAAMTEMLEAQAADKPKRGRPPKQAEVEETEGANAA